MSKRAWYRCNPRKARALIEQGVTVRIENGVCYYRRAPRKRLDHGYEAKQERVDQGRGR